MLFKTSTLLTHHTNLTHRFTSRIGGYSQAPYKSNNLAFHVGDKEDDVVTNHKQLAKQLHYDHTKLVHMKQIHSNLVLVVNPEIDHFSAPPECDALVTDLVNVPLMVMIADCTPILFFDPIKKVIAVAHAGRMGALNNIVAETIKTMTDRFSSNKNEIQIILGPSIHSCCYEIGEEVAQEVSDAGYRSALSFKDEKHFLDVNSIIHTQLQELEIPEKNIEDLNICNACHNLSFFSYRADKETTGRNAGVLMLKNC